MIIIKECMLLDDRINKHIGLFNQLDLSNVEKIMVRTTKNEVMVVFYGYINRIDILKEFVDSIIFLLMYEK